MPGALLDYILYKSIKRSHCTMNMYNYTIKNKRPQTTKFKTAGPRACHSAASSTHWEYFFLSYRVNGLTSFHCVRDSTNEGRNG